MVDDDNFYKLGAESKTIIGETTSVLEMLSFLNINKKIISINLLKTKINERYKNHEDIIYLEEYSELKNIIENQEITLPGKKKTNNISIPIDYLLNNFLGRVKNGKNN